MVRLTNEQAIEMMKAKLECMKRDNSGSDEVCNKKGCDSCYLNYSQGNMGEQQEWLRMGIKALESQKTGHWEDCAEREPWFRCSECREKVWGGYYNYCPKCGVKMKENK